MALSGVACRGAGARGGGRGRGRERTEGPRGCRL